MKTYIATKDFSSMRLGKVKKGDVVPYDKQKLDRKLIVEQKETKTK